MKIKVFNLGRFGHSLKVFLELYILSVLIFGKSFKETHFSNIELICDKLKEPEKSVTIEYESNKNCYF